MSEERGMYSAEDLHDAATHIRRDLRSGRVPLNVSLGDAIDLLVIVAERLSDQIDRLSEKLDAESAKNDPQPDENGPKSEKAEKARPQRGG